MKDTKTKGEIFYIKRIFRELAILNMLIFMGFISLAIYLVFSWATQQ